MKNLLAIALLAGIAGCGPAKDSLEIPPDKGNSPAASIQQETVDSGYFGFSNVFEIQHEGTRYVFLERVSTKSRAMVLLKQEPIAAEAEKPK